jgi:hypothetical protein
MLQARVRVQVKVRDDVHPFVEVDVPFKAVALAVARMDTAREVERVAGTARAALGGPFERG